MSLELQHPSAQALAWALVHFVWQGAAIALVLVAVQQLGRLSASARYTSGVVAMAVMLAAPVLTFVRLSTAASATPIPVSAPSSPAAVSASSAADAVATPAVTMPVDLQQQSDRAPMLWLPVIVLAVWSTGVIVLSLRLFGGWLVARRLARRALSPVSEEIQVLARRVAGRLALDRVVGVFESSAVSVPMMIGWIKPVVLLPTAAVAGLSIAQVEALLAHELAHVRRHDYLINLLQSAVETLLFYHPAVWIVSRRMRVDREHCCDDLAVDVCDRVVYATALSDLAAIARTPRLALAATDGSLVNRVRRILGQSTAQRDAGSGWLSVCLVVLLVVSIAPVALSQDTQTTADRTAVAGGVAGGVQTGVPGGVATGVAAAGETVAAAGGVVGGVREGVAGGVVGGVQAIAGLFEAPAKAAAQASQAAEQARIEEMKALEARLRQLEEERAKIQEARAENELRRTESQAKTRLMELEVELKRLHIDRARVEEQVKKGAASVSSIAEIDAKIAIAQNQLAAEQAEMEFHRRDADLRRMEMALEREALRTDRDREFSARKDAREFEAVGLRALNRKVAESLKELPTVELDPNAAAAVGDLVLVLIHNEPELPRTYVVQKDGTIRFPFLGAIRVEGLNTRQVRDALSKQLADRKLAAGSSIDIAIHRGRTVR